MDFLARLLRFFRRSRPAEPTPTVPELAPEPAAEVSAQPPVYSSPAPSLPEALVVTARPDWFETEDLLRDEGVVYGLTDADPVGKTSVIRAYFTQETASIEQELERLDEKIGELNLWINQKEDRITELETTIQSLKSQQFTDSHQLPRTLVGLTLSVLMGIGNYFLIEETLRGSGYDQTPLIALGVFLAGMFTLFGRVSFLHAEESENRVQSWKQALEEIGLPLAAAFFVFVQALRAQTVLGAIAVFFFVFFLFLFTGKLMLGTLTLIKNDWDVASRQRQLRRDKVQKVEEWEADIAKYKADVERFRQEKQEILPQYARLSAEKAALFAHRDRLVHLFESEYALARSVRARLEKKVIQRILGGTE